jgi:hypothetical protein
MGALSWRTVSGFSWLMAISQIVSASTAESSRVPMSPNCMRAIASRARGSAGVACAVLSGWCSTCSIAQYQLYVPE